MNDERLMQYRQYNREECLLRIREDVYNILDNTKFNRVHLKTVIVTGLGFLTDMYDLFAINLVMMMMTQVYCTTSRTDIQLGQIYCHYPNHTGFSDLYTNKTPVSILKLILRLIKDNVCGGSDITNDSLPQNPNRVSLPSIIDTSVKASSIIGVMFGQAIFGILGDRLGRTRMYGFVLAIMIIGAFGSAFSSATMSGLNVFGVLIMWRVILGVGIGGDFPLSAVITAEFANKERRGAMIAAVNAMQGLGILAQSFVTLISLAAFRTYIQQDSSYLDYVWRITLGLGTVPACLGIISRMHIPETPRYTLEIDNDYERAAGDVDALFKGTKRRNYVIRRLGENRPTLKEFFKYFGCKKNFKLLLGTVVPRFALNVAFYGINLNSSIILTAIGFGISTDVYTTIFHNATGQIVIALIGSIPGYILSVLLIDRIGRKRLQIICFSILTVIYIVLGCVFNQIRCTSMWLFAGIYVFSQIVCNTGPNTTVFVIPAEVFPTRIRSTAYGLSAAIGKLGAAISEIGFFRLKDYYGPTNSGLPLIIQIFAGFMFIGFMFSFFLPETKNRSLEEISKEYEKEDDTLIQNSMSMGEVSVIKVDNDTMVGIL